MITLKHDGLIAKFIRNWEGYPGSNLCEVFWQFTGRFLGLLALGVLSGAYLIGGGLLYLNWGYPYMHITELLFAIFSFFGTIIGIALSIFYFSNTATSSRWMNNIDEVYDAIHDKYCPPGNLDKE